MNREHASSASTEVLIIHVAVMCQQRPRTELLHHRLREAAGEKDATDCGRGEFHSQLRLSLFGDPVCGDIHVRKRRWGPSVSHFFGPK